MNSDTVYETYKDDNDPILDTKSFELDKSIKLLARIEGVPFYQTNLNGLLAVTIEKIENLQNRKKISDDNLRCILPIDPYKFRWLIKKEKYKSLVLNPFLNIPNGAGLGLISKLYQQPIPELVAIDDYIMSLVQLSDAKRYTIFFLGGTLTSLDTLINNLKRSYPNLRTVGKYHANIKHTEISKKVKEGIIKSNPNIVLLGLSYKKSLDFILKYEEEFKKTKIIFLILGDDFNTLINKRKFLSTFFKTRYLEWFWKIIKNPFLWYRFFSVLILLFMAIKVFFKKK